MWRMITATCLLIVAMGSTDQHEAGVFFWLMPFMVLFAVAFVVDAARERAKHAVQASCAVESCRRPATIGLAQYSEDDLGLVALRVCPAHFNLHPTRSDYVRRDESESAT